MATPAFIYAFDNLGPDRFAEVCGLLLASRYAGFLLGGVGPDGGIDAEVGTALGEWRPEESTPLLDETVAPGQLAIFQFKHKVTARTGQVVARRDLIDLYRCTSSKTCELHREQIVARRPAAYVLVTNVEVNAPFRAQFIEKCRSENVYIGRYQIIGLDEIETWMRAEPQIGHLYLPTIFGEPRFQLRIQVSIQHLVEIGGGDQSVPVLCVTAHNVGTVVSYPASVRFRVLVDGQSKYVSPFAHPRDALLQEVNARFGVPLEPGRRAVFYYRLVGFAESLREMGTDVTLAEALVKDEIDNVYSAPVPAEVRLAARDGVVRPQTYGERYV